ncbi:ribosome maturation factor RimM [Rhodohalobacter sp. 8-1]|uniref:ribosome maturation factor RimM n=1 Tax=Rhodohalobacter sp. 8-1 TaxID=3131972 RepID=UPI0030EE9FE1
MNSRLHEIGRIGRPRGLDGWVRFEPDSPSAATMLSENQIVYLNDPRSGYRPLRIEDVYTEEKRNRVSFFVKFDMITNRTDAEEVKDKAIFSDQFDPDADIESIETDDIDYTGYDIIADDSDKSIGSILDVMENPAHSIIKAKIGKGSLLIPFVDEYISDVDHDKRIIRCHNLDQLMEEE